MSNPQWLKILSGCSLPIGYSPNPWHWPRPLVICLWATPPAMLPSALPFLLGHTSLPAGGLYCPRPLIIGLAMWLIWPIAWEVKWGLDELTVPYVFGHVLFLPFPVSEIQIVPERSYFLSLSGSRMKTDQKQNHNWCPSISEKWTLAVLSHWDLGATIQPKLLEYFWCPISSWSGMSSLLGSTLLSNPTSLLPA